MKKGIFFAVLIVMLVFTPVAFAANESVWDMANSDQYGKKAGGMFMRGLLNLSTSFVDVIVQTVEGTQEGPPFVGSLRGLGTGIGCTAVRAMSGGLDLATFWVPGFNGIPVSRSYSNCLEVEEEETVQSSVPSSAPIVTEAQEAPSYMEEPKAFEKQRDRMEYVKK